MTKNRLRPFENKGYGFQDISRFTHVPVNKQKVENVTGAVNTRSNEMLKILTAVLSDSNVKYRTAVGLVTNDVVFSGLPQKIRPWVVHFNCNSPFLFALSP